MIDRVVKGGIVGAEPEAAMKGARRRAGGEADVPVLNLTPMIDVVFQLIIFFLCAMRFRTLDRKLEVALPRHVGPDVTANPDDRVVIRVELRQERGEGVPRVRVLGEEVRPDVGRDAPPPPALARSASRDETIAFESRHRAFWARHFGPKLDDLRTRLARLRATGSDLRWSVDAGPTVRHEFVVGVIDTFVEAGIENVEIRATTGPRPGD